MNNPDLVKKLARRAWILRHSSEEHEQVLRLERFSAHWMPRSAEHLDAWDWACAHVAIHGDGRTVVEGIAVDVRVRWHVSGPGIDPATQHASIEVQARPVDHWDARCMPVSDEPRGPLFPRLAPRVIELFGEVCA